MGRRLRRSSRVVIKNKELEGPVNLAAPNPIQQGNFMDIYRTKMGIGYHVPVPREWMVRVFAFFYRTESEVILKSRRVVPGKLLKAGFQFRYPDWESAADDTIKKFKANGLERSYCGNLCKVVKDV